MIKFAKKHPLITLFSGFLFSSIIFIFYVIASTSETGGISIPRGSNLAVIEIDGVIIDSKDTIDEIIAIKKNEYVKSVVVRINSPGGGVAPSQEIYSELLKLREKKTVVASLSSVAASGGYYIASAAEKIVANPGTLTGSIGVVMDFSNMKGLLEKVGLKSFVVKSGKFKDIGSPVRDMTKEERNLLQDVIDNVHEQFVSAIVNGRGMSREKVEKIADGRIFSGEQALELGLVDELGSLQDSIKIAADMAGIEGEPKVFYREKKKYLLDYLLGNKSKELFGRLTMPQFMYVLSFP